jgi:hypothetical protein
MRFDIYVRSSNNPDIEIWSEISVRDFISQAKQIDALAKAKIEVDPAMVLEMGDGSKWYKGDFIKLSFISDELSIEEFSFLKALAENNMDVLFLDNEGSLVYGCKKINLEVQPITINQSKLIQIAGSREGIENLIFYRIKPFSVTISFPRNGYIYNSNLTEVTGIAL